MNKYILPSVGIIVVAIILVTLNELTEMTFIKDYALIFIMSGMFLGIALTKYINKSKNS